MKTPAALLVCLLLYGALMWIWGAGRLDFHDSMESSRAVVTRGMLESGDYVVLRLGTHPYLAKPPLFYWAAAGTSALTGGVSELSVRLVSALSAMALLVVIYLGVRPVGGPTAAILSCVAAATMPIVFEGATCGLVNMLLALGVAMAVFGAFHMLEADRHSRAWAVLCGVGLTAGLLTKGPIVLMFFVPALLAYLGFRHNGPFTDRPLRCAGFLGGATALVWLAGVLGSLVGGIAAVIYVLPAAMVLYFALGARQARTRGWEWLIAAGVCLALTAPWPLLAAHGLGLQALLATLKHETYRAGLEKVGTSNFGPIWLYALEYPPAALPFSLLAPLPFLRGYSGAVRTSRSRLLLMAKCWLIGSFLLFTFSTTARRIRYLIPAFPAVAVLAGDVMARAAAGDLRDRMARYVRGASATVTYLLCASPFALIGLWLTRVPDMRGWAVASAAVAAVGAALGVYLWRVRRLRWAPLLALAVVLVGAKMLVLMGLPSVENAKDRSRAIAQALRDEVPAGQPLYLYELTSRSVMFYLDARTWRDGETAADLAGRNRAYVCTEADELPTFPVPAGFTATETTRTKFGRWQLVLLRLDRTG